MITCLVLCFIGAICSLKRSESHLNLSSCLILLHIKGFGFPLWVFSALGSRDDRLVTCHYHSDTFGIGSAMIILCAKSLLLLTSTMNRWSRRSRLSLSSISRTSTWAQDEQYSWLDKKRSNGSSKNI